MSRERSIDLGFSEAQNFTELLRRLRAHGWEPVHDDKIGYSIDYLWDTAAVHDESEALARVAAGLEAGSTVAVKLWGHGGHSLDFVMDPDRTTLFFILDEPRKLLPNSPLITDLSWYLDRLLPAIQVESLNHLVAGDTHP